MSNQLPPRMLAEDHIDLRELLRHAVPRQGEWLKRFHEFACVVDTFRCSKPEQWTADDGGRPWLPLDAPGSWANRTIALAMMLYRAKPVNDRRTNGAPKCYGANLTWGDILRIMGLNPVLLLPRLDPNAVDPLSVAQFVADVVGDIVERDRFDRFQVPSGKVPVPNRNNIEGAFDGWAEKHWDKYWPSKKDSPAYGSYSKMIQEPQQQQQQRKFPARRVAAGGQPDSGAKLSRKQMASQGVSFRKKAPSKSNQNEGPTRYQPPPTSINPKGSYAGVLSQSPKVVEPAAGAVGPSANRPKSPAAPQRPRQPTNQGTPTNSAPAKGGARPKIQGVKADTPRSGGNADGGSSQPQPSSTQAQPIPSTSKQNPQQPIPSTKSGDNAGGGSSQPQPSSTQAQPILTTSKQNPQQPPKGLSLVYYPEYFATNLSYDTLINKDLSTAIAAETQEEQLAIFPNHFENYLGTYIFELCRLEIRDRKKSDYEKLKQQAEVSEDELRAKEEACKKVELVEVTVDEIKATLNILRQKIEASNKHLFPDAIERLLSWALLCASRHASQ